MCKRDGQGKRHRRGNGEERDKDSGDRSYQRGRRGCDARIHRSDTRGGAGEIRRRLSPAQQREPSRQSRNQVSSQLTPSPTYTLAHETSLSSTRTNRPHTERRRLDLRHLHPRQPLHLPRLRRLRHRASLPSSLSGTEAQSTGPQARSSLQISAERETNSPHEQEIRA